MKITQMGIAAQSFLDDIHGVRSLNPAYILFLLCTPGEQICKVGDAILRCPKFRKYNFYSFST